MLTLTPELCAAVYDALLLTQPFANWNLPAGEDVHFHIIKTDKFYGDYEYSKRQHIIRISQGLIGTWRLLLVKLAHEMVHLHLKQNKCNGRRDHGLAFKRSAALVCKHHRDFDPKDF